MEQEGKHEAGSGAAPTPQGPGSRRVGNPWVWEPLGCCCAHTGGIANRSGVGPCAPPALQRAPGGSHAGARGCAAAAAQGRGGGPHGSALRLRRSEICGNAHRGERHNAHREERHVWQPTRKGKAERWDAEPRGGDLPRRIQTSGSASGAPGSGVGSEGGAAARSQQEAARSRHAHSRTLSELAYPHHQGRSDCTHQCGRRERAAAVAAGPAAGRAGGGRKRAGGCS
ncbi:MAG: hypothetical protein J3K34DRAFT_436011 [Monoraphidium minutum]|nr:MAG: hypothetical protein J3K34DRAFT_436011 [Monoraphidium minutum]